MKSNLSRGWRKKIGGENCKKRRRGEERRGSGNNEEEGKRGKRSDHLLLFRVLLPCVNIGHTT